MSEEHPEEKMTDKKEPEEIVDSSLPSAEKVDSESLKTDEKPTTESQPTLTPKELKTRNKLFHLITIGSAAGQSFLFNFFGAFAVVIGASVETVGFITSVRNLMSSLFQGTFGRLSDKYGRRRFLLLGFFLVISTIVIFLFINSIEMLIVVSVIQAFSLSIIIPVWSGAFGDVTKISERARYIGRLTSIGTAISVTLMLSLSLFFELTDNVYTNWYIFNRHIQLEERDQYLVAFGLAAFNFLLCLIGSILLKETRVVKEKKAQPKMLLALKNKPFRKFLIVNSLFGLIMSTLWPLIPFAHIDILEMSFSQIAIVTGIFSASSSVAQFFGGKLGDQFGRKPLIILSRMLMFPIPLVMIGAILQHNWLWLILSNIFGGASTGTLNVSQNAYVLDLAHRDQMGAYSGITQVAWGFATFTGSISAGFIVSSIVNRLGSCYLGTVLIYAFIIIAILRLVASIDFFFIVESYPKELRDKIKLERKLSKNQMSKTQIDSRENKAK